MNNIQLGQSDLHVTPICLGTMTFGEQVNESDSHDILSRSLARGVNFIDTAEMYSVPAKAETFGATETIIGNWFAKNPGARQKLVVATKVAGPSRGMPWVRDGKGMAAADIVASCEGSLRRLQTDVIDLYQIHWPERHVPAFGNLYYDPSKETSTTPIREQLEALSGLGKAGKYDESGITGPSAPQGARIATYESVRKQRWGRPEALTASRRYNALARANGMTPTQMALAFCYTKWQGGRTIIGVTSVAQLDEDLNAWGTTLSPEVLKEIDAIRWELRDPAL